MHNFLYQNISTFPLYILLTKRINTFWCESINRFWSGSNEQCGLENHKQKISNIYILHTTQTTYYLTNKILCDYLPLIHLFLT